MPVETISTKTYPFAKAAVWIEVYPDRILRNLERLRQKIRPYTRVMAVIKANAYGHGLVSVAQTLQGQVDLLGIGSLKEASLLREQGVISPLFLFGRLFQDEVPIALQMNLTLTVSSLEEAQAISEAASLMNRKEKVAVHVKVDTGMGRLGMPLEQAITDIEKMASLPNLQLEGIYTHFPAAERYPDSFTAKQLEDFERLIEDLRRKEISFSLRHAANSAGALRFKSHALNLVRPGIALYGIYPHSSFEGEIDLEPALALKTRIVFIKRLSTGASVGYGREFICQRPTNIAILPTGYAHGFPFHLSNQGQALCRGRRFNIAGRVCMDSMMIDLENAEDIRPGDEVTLLGSSGEDRIRVEEIAQRAKTISYEIVTRLEAGIPRHYRSSQPS